jgi:hypothetical protein
MFPLKRSRWAPDLVWMQWWAENFQFQHGTKPSSYKPKESITKQLHAFTLTTTLISLLKHPFWLQWYFKNCCEMKDKIKPHYLQWSLVGYTVSLPIMSLVFSLPFDIITKINKWDYKQVSLFLFKFWFQVLNIKYKNGFSFNLTQHICIHYILYL